MAPDSLSQLSLFSNSDTPQDTRQSEEMAQHFNSQIRNVTHEGVTHYSLVDICEQFADTSQDARKYWNDTKKRLAKESFQSSERIRQLKLVSPKDGKKYLTDVADAETCLRIVQAISSPKAEPIRLWLARVAYERLEEIAQPGLATDNARRREIAGLRARGMSQDRAEEWLEQREKGKQIRLGITGEWKIRGAHGKDYVRLTDDVNSVALGASAQALKQQLKLAKNDNLRDHLSAAEIATVGATEYFAAGLHAKRDSHGIDELSDDVKDTRTIIDAARDAIKTVFSKERPRRN